MILFNFSIFIIITLTNRATPSTYTAISWKFPYSETLLPTSSPIDRCRSTNFIISLSAVDLTLVVSMLRLCTGCQSIILIILLRCCISACSRWDRVKLLGKRSLCLGTNMALLSWVCQEVVLQVQVDIITSLGPFSLPGKVLVEYGRLRVANILRSDCTIV